MLDYLKRKLHPFGGYRMDSDCACAAAPDYSGVAAASKESAEIMAALGREQLAETRRQYDQNSEVARPIVEGQAALMNQAIEQGDDYYSFMKEYGRPVDIALQEEAMAAGSVAKQEEAAGLAMADARQGSTAMQNQLIRQGLRYGYSPEKLAVMASTMAGQQGLEIASAANQAREKEKNLGFAKKLDVSGVFRGLPGASQGAYSVANQSGNSAVGNQMAPSGQLLAGMSSAAGITGQGQAMQLGGLQSIMNSQQAINIANAQMMNSGGGDLLSGLGSIAMGAGALGWKPFSDPALKENVVLVDESPLGFNIYEFNFKGDETRWRGVMADEVEEVMPEAITIDSDGYRHVNYDMIGIEMTRVE